MDQDFRERRVSGNERLALILGTCRAQMLNTRLYTNVLQSLTERLNTMMSLDMSPLVTPAAARRQRRSAPHPRCGNRWFFQYNGPGYQN